MVGKRVWLVWFVSLVFILSGVLIAIGQEPQQGNFGFLSLNDSTIYDEENNTCTASRYGMDILVRPCIASDINGKDIQQYVNFTWNGGATQNTSWIFVYNSSLEYGKIEAFNSNLNQWFDVSNQIEFLGSNLTGNDYVYYTVQSAIFNPGQIIETRWTFTPEDNVKSGKWSIFGKLADQSISEAIASDLYILMDPNWESSYNTNIISYYDFEQSSGDLQDVNLGTYNGTVNGTPERNVAGILGNAWDFNNSLAESPSHWVQINDLSGVAYNNNFSFSLWFKVSEADNVSNRRAVISESRLNADQEIIYAGVDNNRTGSGHRANSDAGFSNLVGDNLITDEWQHIVYVMNTTDQIIYVNGTQKATGTIPTGDFFSQIITIGARITNVKNFGFDGIIDEIGIWNRTLTPSEISDIYNNGQGVQFSIDFTSPQVTIDYPSNTTYGSSDNPLGFNVSLNEQGSSVLYSLNGNSNVTMSTIDNLNYNDTNGSLAQGSYNLVVYVNDTNNNLNFTENVSFTLDLTNPNITINEPVGTLGSQSIEINITALDDLALDTCYFNISRGSSVEVSNTNIANCMNTTISVSSDANYVIWVTINDTGNNINIMNQSFSVDTSGGGGGTGGSSSTPPVQVVGQNVSWTVQTENGAGQFDLSMRNNQERVVTAQFINTGDNQVNLEVECQGSGCQFGKLETDSLILPSANVRVATNLDITLTTPDDFSSSFSFNIVGIDQEGNEGVLPVRVDYSPIIGTISSFIDKAISLLGFVSLIIALVTFAVLNFLVFPKSTIGTIASPFIAFGLFILIVSVF